MPRFPQRATTPCVGSGRDVRGSDPNRDARPGPRGFHVAGLSHRRESAANARLIAQAPVMLELLKRWNGSVDVSEFAAEARTILRAIERESNYGNSA
jgi:hypothetical protein